jgi:O-acetyl-ADP-ribose deacetylase (regulator of RNase III)
MTIEIQTKKGNLMDVTAGHIVHGCNAQGVMGSGVALAVKNTYPYAYQDYRRIYEADASGGLVLGDAYPVEVSPALILWNAVTQHLYGTHRRQVNYEAIATCFERVNEGAIALKDTVLSEIHIPMIGAGLGGGNWNIIKSIIEETVSCPVTLWIL